MSDAFSSGTGDGLLGLAFGNINTVKPKPVATPVTNMGNEKVIPPVFSLLNNYLTVGRTSLHLCTHASR